MNAFADGFVLFGYVDCRRICHNSGIGQRHFCNHRTFSYNYHSAAQPAHAVCCESHIRFARADDNQVMGIVRNRSGNGALLKTDSADKSKAYVTCISVPFDNRKLEDVFFGIDAVIIAKVDVKQRFFRYKLVLDKVYYTAFADSRSSNVKILFAKGRKIERMEHTLFKRGRNFRIFKFLKLSRRNHFFAKVVNVADRNGIKVIKHRKVCGITRRYGAFVFKAKGFRRLKRRHPYAGYGAFARFYGKADYVVNMTVCNKVGGVLVIGDKKAATVPWAVKKVNKTGKVARRGTVSYHNTLPFTDALLRFIRRGTFVVVANAGGNIFVKIAAGQKGSVPVYNLAFSFCGIYFVHNSFVAGNNAHIIHHFRKTEHTGTAIERLYIRGGKLRSGFVKRGCRYA